MTELDANVRPSLQRLSKEIQLHKKMVQNGLLPSCISCEHFSRGVLHRKKAEQDARFCHKWQAVPPLDTLVYGCEAYEWDLPF